MIRSGVNVMHSFAAPHSGDPFSRYVDYINRKKAATKEGAYDEYLGYMDNPLKNAALFTAGADSLSKAEKESLSKMFDLAEENDSVLYQTVFSFDNNWLEKHHLYDPKTNTVDEHALHSYTRGAMKRLLKKENLDKTSIWAAAIHYNTDNIHIHVATVEPEPTREKKHYRTLRFSKRWLEDHDVMNAERYGQIEKEVFKSAGTDKKIYQPIMNDLKKAVKEETGVPFFCTSGMYFDKFGNLQISVSDTVKHIPDGIPVIREYDQYDGKFKQKSLDSAKSYIANEILNERETNLEINRIIREEMIGPYQDEAYSGFPLDEDLMNQYNKIYDKLQKSGVAPGKWNYGLNKLDVQKDLDRLTDTYLGKYQSEQLEHFHKEVSRIAKDYQEAYGGNNSAQEYIETKYKDMHKRMGNAILKTMREQAGSQQYERRKRKRRKRSYGTASRFHQPDHLAYSAQKDLKRAQYLLMKSMETTWEQEQNIRAYERMEAEIEYNNERARANSQYNY